MVKEVGEIKNRICNMVLRKMDFSDDLSEEEVLKSVDDIIISLPERENMPLEEILNLRKEVYNSIKRYDVIQEYLDDETVSEIMINGVEAIFVERGGTLFKTDKTFSSKEKLAETISNDKEICRKFMESNKIKDLPDIFQNME